MNRGWIILGFLIAVVFFVGIAGLHLGFLLVLGLLAVAVGIGIGVGRKSVSGGKGRKRIRK